MNVCVPNELVPYVANLVSAGTYPTVEEVVRTALAQMRDREEKFESLRSSMEEAIAELDRTGGIPVDPEEIKRKGRERLAAMRQQA